MLKMELREQVYLSTNVIAIMGKNEHCFYRSIMQNMHGFGL